MHNTNIKKYSHISSRLITSQNRLAQPTSSMVFHGSFTRLLYELATTENISSAQNTLNTAQISVTPQASYSLLMLFKIMNPKHWGNYHTYNIKNAKEGHIALYEASLRRLYEITEENHENLSA